MVEVKKTTNGKIQIWFNGLFSGTYSRAAADIKITKHYELEIEKATTINELVWIDTDYKQNETIGVNNLFKLIRKSDAKKEAFEAAGQEYTRATKPAWR